MCRADSVSRKRPVRQRGQVETHVVIVMTGGRLAPGAQRALCASKPCRSLAARFVRSAKDQGFSALVLCDGGAPARRHLQVGQP